jgi:hypothetical protein
MPAIIRISPIVGRETPETWNVRAYRMIAPTAIRNMELPNVTG